MSSAVRWQFALPWLLVLIALLFVAQMVLARLARTTVEGAGEESLGAKVEVGEARVSLLTSRMALRRISVANPLDPAQNLAEADRCDLHVEPSALLRKRLVVDRGVMTGVRFGQARDDNSAADDSAGQSQAWLDPHAADAASAWLDRLQERFDGELVEQLESLRLTEELLARWPEQHAAMRERVEQMRQRTTEFQASARKGQVNPLRHVEFLEKMPDEIGQLREDLAALTDEVRNLPATTDADRRAIVAARKHDEQFLREQLRFERIDANSLTAYLLEQQLAGPLADVFNWLRWMRRVVPAESPLTPSRGRGQDVVFAGCERAPGFLIRAMDIRGTAQIGNQPVELTGTLTDFTSRPRLHDQPTRLRLTSAGQMPLELQATIDRTGPVARDQLLVDCDRALVPSVQLGGSDQLRLSLGPSTATVSVSLRLEGDRLSGDIQLVQRQVEIEPQVSADLARAGVDRELADSLHRVDAFATRISLRGTLEEPQCQVWSNVGPAVAEALDRALVRSAERHCQQMLAESQQRVDERLAQLDRQISEGQATLVPQLAASNGIVVALADDEVRPLRLSIEHLGRRLPADSLFR